MNTFYADDHQLYACLTDLFARIQNESPGGMEALLASRLIIRLRCRAPDAQVTINSRTSPPQVTYGACSLRPDVDAEMAADTLHRILADGLSMKAAIAGGLMKVRGPIWKTSALSEVMRAGRQYYPQVLSDRGLGG